LVCLLDDLTLTLFSLCKGTPNGLRHRPRGGSSRVGSRTSPSGRGAGAGVDSTWDQKNLKVRILSILSLPL